MQMEACHISGFPSREGSKYNSMIIPQQSTKQCASGDIGQEAFILQALKTSPAIFIFDIHLPNSILMTNQMYQLIRLIMCVFAGGKGGGR